MSWASCTLGHAHWGPQGAAGLLLAGRDGCCCSSARGGRTTAAPGRCPAVRSSVVRPRSPRPCARQRKSSGSTLRRGRVRGSRIAHCGGWAYETVLGGTEGRRALDPRPVRERRAPVGARRPRSAACRCTRRSGGLGRPGRRPARLRRSDRDVAVSRPRARSRTCARATSAVASRTRTSWPSGSSPAPVTGASTPSSRTTRCPCVGSSFSSTETTTPSNSRRPGRRAARPRPGRPPRARRPRPLGRALHLLRQPGQRREHPVGHGLLGAQRHAHLAGVAVGEAAQRRGDVGVLRGQRGVLRVGRHLAVEGDVAAAAQQPGAGHDRPRRGRARSGSSERMKSG